MFVITLPGAKEPEARTQTEQLPRLIDAEAEPEKATICRRKNQRQSITSKKLPDGHQGILSPYPHKP